MLVCWYFCLFFFTRGFQLDAVFWLVNLSAGVFVACLLAADIYVRERRESRDVRKQDASAFLVGRRSSISTRLIVESVNNTRHLGMFVCFSSVSAPISEGEMKSEWQIKSTFQTATWMALFFLFF